MDLDDEELEATRILTGATKSKNINIIEEKRTKLCNKLKEIKNEIT